MTGITLLTGATGFVGRQVLRALGAQGAQVRLVVREGRANAVEKPDCVERIISTSDLFDEPPAWWAETCDGVDTIVHVAWYAEPGKYLTSAKNLDCLAGTLAMAKGAGIADVRRFVGIGTCFEYRLTSDDLATTTPLDPTTPYAAAKAAAYMALSQILPQQGMEFVWCRLFYLFGEGEDARRFVPYLHSQLKAGAVAELTSGEQIRDFLDVAQAGNLIAKTALSRIEGAANICSGEAITIRALAERIADQYGRRDLLRFGARPDNLVDPPRVVGIPTRIPNGDEGIG
jgi:nucleoside-diphosphate-sugar epimerase